MLVPWTTASSAADSTADRSAKNLSKLEGEVFLNQREPVQGHMIQVGMLDEMTKNGNQVKESQILHSHHP